MKTVDHSAEISATPEEIIAALLDTDFPDQLLPKLKKVSKISAEDTGRDDQGRIKRVFHYTAPAELPRFLRRFKDRAPEEVNWQEIVLIDPDASRASFEIIADVPEHWHERYDNEGEMVMTPNNKGGTTLRQTMRFKVDSPALGFVINRAIGSEVEDIFKARANVLADRFR